MYGAILGDMIGAPMNLIEETRVKTLKYSMIRWDLLMIR